MPDMKLPERDPTLVALAYKKQRLFLFTRREPADAEDASVSVCKRVMVGVCVLQLWWFMCVCVLWG
jgi:hypothetical protein